MCCGRWKKIVWSMVLSCLFGRWVVNLSGCWIKIILSIIICVVLMIVLLLNWICCLSYFCNLLFILGSVEKFVLFGVVFSGYFKYYLKKLNFIGIVYDWSIKILNFSGNVCIIGFCDCWESCWVFGNFVCYCVMWY